MDEVAPHQLADLLSSAPAGVKVLSLDCFDTLIWRNTHAPRDVFADLAQAGCAADQRAFAESAARERARGAGGREEVAIAEIYEALAPQATPEARAAAVQAELAAEARHCFAFAPTAELIREAKARGLKVVIVSDTYLDKDQLRALIADVGGAELSGLIDEIHCSSRYGMPKALGLFTPVLKALGVAPEAVLHLGDNWKADVAAPRALGVHAVHFKQFSEAAEQRLRLEAAAGGLLDPRLRNETPVYQPHRAQVAISSAVLDDGAVILGYETLGPIMHGFARWLRAEAEALAAQSRGRVHTLFVMRDGWLPKLVFDALAQPGEAESPAIEISRFTAIASAFHTAEDALRFAEANLEGMTVEVLARQLLFTPDEARGLARGRDAKAAFLTELRRERTLAKVVARSQAMAERLVAYVRAQVDVRPGDTLVLADLGYNGTVQNYVEPLLRRALGVSVAGRYFLLREQSVSGCDKAGLIDRTAYDHQALHALTASVAVLEQLCTAAQGSVVDYDAQGRPIRAGEGIKGRQSQVRDVVQQACVQFALGYGSAFVAPPRSDGVEASRQAAASAFARLAFLPQPDELAALDSFEHDVNLGTSDTLKLFDHATAAEGLKRLGLFYMNNATRMYLPAELRGQGLPLSLTLMAMRRFGLDIRYADFSDDAQTLPVMIADQSDVHLDQVRLAPTHDGYRLAAAPVGAGRYTVGLRFGQLYDWIQLESVEFVRAADFMGDKPAEDWRRSPASPVFEAMETAGSGLMRCLDETAFMMTPPPAGAGEEAWLLVVVFRPLAMREHSVAAVDPMRTAAE